MVPGSRKSTTRVFSRKVSQSHGERPKRSCDSWVGYLLRIENNSDSADGIERHIWGRWSVPPAKSLTQRVHPEEARAAEVTPLRSKKEPKIRTRENFCKGTTSSIDIGPPKRNEIVIPSSTHTGLMLKGRGTGSAFMFSTMTSRPSINPLELSYILKRAIFFPRARSYRAIDTKDYRAHKAVAVQHQKRQN